ncbi:hypothetical protein CYJ16_08600 [Actinotignum timonense]|nr:hypothetical protein CYJ16_08600 [Actinotignum timonense]
MSAPRLFGCREFPEFLEFLDFREARELGQKFSSDLKFGNQPRKPRIFFALVDKEQGRQPFEPRDKRSDFLPRIRRVRFWNGIVPGARIRSASISGASVAGIGIFGVANDGITIRGVTISEATTGRLIFQRINTAITQSVLDLRGLLPRRAPKNRSDVPERHRAGCAGSRHPPRQQRWFRSCAAGLRVAE